MTYPEFLAHLSKIKPGEWKLERESLRLHGTFRHGDFCPITAVCYAQKNYFFSTHEYREAAREIGLEPNLTERIASSADNTYYLSDFSAKIRKDILEATQLITNE